MHSSSSSGSGNTGGTGAARGTASATPPEGKGKTEEQQKEIKVPEAKPRRPRNPGNLYQYLDWPLPHSPQFDGSLLNPVPRKAPARPHGVQAEGAGEPHYHPTVTSTTSTSSTSATQTLTTTTTVATTTTTTTIAFSPNDGGDTAASAELGKLLSGHHRRQGLGWNSFDDEDAVLRQHQAWNPSEEELIGIIFDRDPAVLIEEESMMLCAAARQSSTMALEMLMQPERAIAFHPFDRTSNRGWHPEHCPFRCSVDHDRPLNLKLLLAHGARPGAAFAQTLQQLPAWAKDILREYDYML